MMTPSLSFNMKRIVVEGEILKDILFLDAFENMVRIKKKIKNVEFPLIKFAGSVIYALGSPTFHWF